MSEEIRKLKPEALWENFYKLTQVPRPSKHEDGIQAFMMAWCEEHGLETIKDEVGNIIVKKPATPGMEDRKGVILQAHLDMVPQKNSSTDHSTGVYLTATRSEVCDDESIRGPYRGSHIPRTLRRLHHRLRRGIDLVCRRLGATGQDYPVAPQVLGLVQGIVGEIQ